MTGFPILFLEPLALIGLLALPIIWLLLRFTPPRPKRVTFPATRILVGLEKREETRARSPWWLTLLRILVAALVIFALARPTLNPQTTTLSGSGPVAILIDDGWGSGPAWERITAMAEQIIAEADRDGRPVTLQTTGLPDGRDAPVALAARDARGLLDSLVPQPFAPDRSAALAALAALGAAQAPGDVVWLSDGLSHETDAAAFASALQAAFPDAGLTVFGPDDADLPLVLTAPRQDEGSLVVDVTALGQIAPGTTLRALDQRGRPVAGAPVEAIDDGALARFDLPIEIRNEITRIEVAGGQSAASVQLLDDRFQRKSVGLISATVVDEAQPLLSPLHYIGEALGPFADVSEPRGQGAGEALRQVLEDGASLLVLADIGTLIEDDEALLTQWIEAGGIAVRFSGPRLAAADDPLVPVRLRQGERQLGGALSWSEPQGLAEFPETGAFSGLAVPNDILIERQVLAEPDIDLQSKTWATLADGTPLVTAERRGNGWLVLFHVTADTSWSNLPLSGIFVDMLRRILQLAAAPQAVSTTTDDVTETAGEEALSRSVEPSSVLRPIRVLNGFGSVVPPSVIAQPIAAADVDTIQPGPTHPPGLYGSENAFRALNLFSTSAELALLSVAGTTVTEAAYPTEEPRPVGPWLLVAALILLALDSLAILFLSGLRPRFIRPAEQAMVLALAIGLGTALMSGQAVAQDSETTAAEDLFALEATLETRLAYVRTGDSEIDETSRLGLLGLSRALANRTALEPGAPMGIDVTQDEMAFFPLIYWPVTEATDVPPADVLARIDRYMKSGGTILFDTQDQVGAGANWTGTVGPGMQRLRALLSGLDLPAIEPVPVDHVLTKTFYLLQDFPGRFDGSPLWVEALERDPNAPPRPAYNADGVSSIMITSNDLTGAWATDDAGNPLYPVVPGGELQREMAIRVGINIVMYTLTGNYKADQV
ncbi:MAG: DUF4159 domain-containing protein, partial [Pseudomonadota bacterium]